MTLVRIWRGQRYGEMRALIAWLHEEVVPAARAAAGCTGVEALVDAGDGHDALLATRWQSVEDHDEWDEGEHGSLWSYDVTTYEPLEDAVAMIEADERRR